MTILGSIFEFLAPFRDLLVDRLRPKPEIPREERAEYLDKIDYHIKQEELAKAATASKAIFGSQIRGEILVKIWGHKWDQCWLAEKYLEAGGERTFRWDDKKAMLRPIPVGMNVEPYWSMGSFEKLRRNATKNALVALCGVACVVAFGFIGLQNQIARSSIHPSNHFTIISAAVFFTILFLLFLSFFIAGLKSEAKYSAANAFWTAWCEKEIPMDPEDDSSTGDSKIRSRTSGNSWAIQNIIVIYGIYLMVIIQLSIHLFQSYLTEIALFMILLVELNILLKWRRIIKHAIIPSFGLKLFTFSTSVVLIPLIAFYTWALLRHPMELITPKCVIVATLCIGILVVSGMNAHAWLTKDGRFTSHPPL